MNLQIRITANFIVGFGKHSACNPYDSVKLSLRFIYNYILDWGVRL